MSVKQQQQHSLPGSPESASHHVSLETLQPVDQRVFFRNVSRWNQSDLSSPNCCLSQFCHLLLPGCRWTLKMIQVGSCQDGHAILQTLDLSDAEVLLWSDVSTKSSRRRIWRRLVAANLRSRRCWTRPKAFSRCGCCQSLCVGDSTWCVTCTHTHTSRCFAVLVDSVICPQPIRTDWSSWQQLKPPWNSASFSSKHDDWFSWLKEKFFRWVFLGGCGCGQFWLFRAAAFFCCCCSF